MSEITPSQTVGPFFAYGLTPVGRCEWDPNGTYSWKNSVESNLVTPDTSGTRIRVVGKALGADARAEALAAEVDAKLKAAENRTAALKERKRVLFVLSLAGGKVLASGSGTAADGMIRLAGGVNAVEGYEGYKQLSDEAIVTARPDVVLVMDHAGPGVSEADLFANPAIAQTPAGTVHRLVRMDGGYLLGFGPRAADAVNDLAAALYGGQSTH